MLKAVFHIDPTVTKFTSPLCRAVLAEEAAGRVEARSSIGCRQGSLDVWYDLCHGHGKPSKLIAGAFRPFPQSLERLLRCLKNESFLTSRLKFESADTTQSGSLRSADHKMFIRSKAPLITRILLGVRKLSTREQGPSLEPGYNVWRHQTSWSFEIMFSGVVPRLSAPKGSTILSLPPRIPLRTGPLCLYPPCHF